jgi:hypothetical protein
MALSQDLKERLKVALAQPAAATELIDLVEDLDSAVEALEAKVAANVPEIETPSGDAETTVNAVIAALVAAELMDAP